VPAAARDRPVEAPDSSVHTVRLLTARLLLPARPIAAATTRDLVFADRRHRLFEGAVLTALVDNQRGRLVKIVAKIRRVRRDPDPDRTVEVRAVLRYRSGVDLRVRRGTRFRFVGPPPPPLGPVIARFTERAYLLPNSTVLGVAATVTRSPRRDPLQAPEPIVLGPIDGCWRRGLLRHAERDAVLISGDFLPYRPEEDLLVERGSRPEGLLVQPGMVVRKASAPVRGAGASAHAAPQRD
jgi:hypothetical protein